MSAPLFQLTPAYPLPQSSSSFNTLNVMWKLLIVLVGLALISFTVYIIYTAVGGISLPWSAPSVSSSSAVDNAPLPIDGKSGTVIPAASVPIAAGSDYGIQFWMYIKDWDYAFGQAKPILTRADATNQYITNPNISLSATDNNLDVSISVFGSDSVSSGASSPAPANGAGATGDLFTVTVENVPLQTWFAVTVTCFQRNVDVYINGNLVKSALLPGVPRPAVGDITVGGGGGFSGSVCNVKSYPNMLGPADASSFYASGTNCSSIVQSSSSAAGSGGTNPASSANFFGYNFTFGILDSSGKTVRSFTT